MLKDRKVTSLVAVSVILVVGICLLLIRIWRPDLETPDGYFSQNYTTARSRFREAVKKAGGRLESLPLDAKGPAGEDLSIDIAWFGAEQPRRVLLHSSGLHGVEAFAGSAIQLQWLEADLPSIPGDAAIVLVHVLNPYGMAWLRRFNENGVDLNRNFLGPDEPYAGAPDGYPKLDSFLNPPTSPANDFYYVRAGWLVARYGLSSLRQAVAGGQYDYPRGVFFGGKQLQQGPGEYQAWLARRFLTAERIVAIDVHTGLGKYGSDTLLVEPEKYDTLRPIFGDRVAASEPDQSPAYRVRGGYDSLLARIAPKTNSYFVCQEFGTYHSVRVLHALREENRWHQHGGGTVEHATKSELKEFFCPGDEAWRKAVLARGKELLQQATGLVF
jgi:hypothetical protein